MKSFKFLGFMILGAAVMFASLLWMSQFFNHDDERIPVIWLNTGAEKQEETSAPWLAK